MVSATSRRLNTPPAKSPRSLLEEGLRFERAGRLADAASRYRQAARLDPHSLAAPRMLGVVRQRQGRLSDAEHSFRAAARVAPQSPDPYIDLGGVLRQRGRLSDAAASYRRAIELKPDYAGAHNNLGIVLRELGRLDEAIASYRCAIQFELRYAEAHYNLGNALTAAGQLDEAIAHYREAIAIRPDYAEMYISLGNALHQQGRHAEAAAAYVRATEIDPSSAAAHRNLGIITTEANRPAEAAEYYRRAAAIAPDMAEAHADLGTALRTLGQFEKALAEYDTALKLRPDYADAHHNRGIALKMLGQIEAARSALQRAVQLAPRSVLSYAALAEIMRFTPGERHLAAMETLAAGLPALSVEERIALHFTLAKAYSDLAEHQACARHLSAGNALKRAQMTYDESAVLGRIELIREVFTPTLMREMRGLGHPTSVPVFIVGMPRSGTTLVEQVLASHPQVYGAGELGAFQEATRALRAVPPTLQPYPELVPSLTGARLSALGEDYLARTGRLAPTADRITDKMPGNFLAVGLIHLALPNARIIHVRRDPIDTCFSCFSTLFAAEHAYSYDLGELGRYYRAYAALMRHWRALVPEEVMIDVQYETLVGDFETEARRIVAHCGLDWNEACREFHRTRRPVLTASMVQVRQPIYQSSVGRWRPFVDMLEPLLAALGDLAAQPIR
jgi:tetratricopeptide (TPR) repeat protein